MARAYACVQPAASTEYTATNLNCMGAQVFNLSIILPIFSLEMCIHISLILINANFHFAFIRISLGNQEQLTLLMESFPK